MNHSGPYRALVVERVLDGDQCRLVLRGELDLASAPVLEAELSKAETSGIRHLALDLSELAFIDSTGLRVLIRAHQSADSNGHTFSLHGQNPQAERLFKLTGMSDRFIFAEESTQAEAVSSD